VYSASEIFVKGDLLAVGPSCIRTDRLWYELQGGAAGSHSFNIRVDGEIKLANRFPTEYTGLMENIPAPSDLLNQIEISAPYEKGLDPDIPKDRIQLRSWRAKELYDFDTIFDEFNNIKVSTFKPNYLNYVNFEDAVYLDKQVRFHAQEPSAEDPEQGVNTVDPSMFLTNTTHVLTGCGTAQDQVRMLAGHYDHIVVITNCRLIVSEGATFENVAIFLLQLNQHMSSRKRSLPICLEIYPRLSGIHQFGFKPEKLGIVIIRATMMLAKNERAFCFGPVAEISNLKIRYRPIIPNLLWDHCPANLEQAKRSVWSLPYQVRWMARTRVKL